MKIIITIPKNKKDKWKLHWSGKGKHFLNPNTLYSGLERRLLASANKEKIAIKVKEGNLTSNETLASDNPKYLLYCLSCFLEDYLSKDVLKRHLNSWMK